MIKLFQKLIKNIETRKLDLETRVHLYFEMLHGEEYNIDSILLFEKEFDEKSPIKDKYCLFHLFIKYGYSFEKVSRLM